ncbi:uncharacterized protein LOC123872442 [Maniola jurtina]|uniref:uncharacterized protein LOC123872442 n=1 Tax=Maniola jurtina TaxID=191418 RepID=UPI001E68F64E|nr:uncharacterized protein LOC123872442 [Maniola jurtina]
MFYLRSFITFALFSVLSTAEDQSQYEIILLSKFLDENGIPVQISDSDTYWMNNQITATNGDKVDVKLYYESLCPDCIKFDTEQFSTTVQKLNQYVNFHTYPYGNAKTIYKNGEIIFECQHGPPECYGNKLHACAIDHLQNITAAIVFNSCMMGGEGGGSNDAAADRCAAEFGIDSMPIKACAKGDRGTQLLEYYGEESKKANFSYVPYILINGKVNDGSNFMNDVCAAFAVPPPPCVQYTVLQAWHFGEETLKMDIKYVPYVMLAGSSDMQDQATVYLMATICQMCAVNMSNKYTLISFFVIILLFICFAIICLALNTNALSKSIELQGMKDSDNFNNFGEKYEVVLKVYYESLCPASVEFYTTQLLPTVEVLGSLDNMKVITIPYGNAWTTHKDGVVEFECQHGPSECYGNKLHACAIDHLKNITAAVVVTSCMMGGGYDESLNAAADRCAVEFGIDSTPIKACAKGDRGTDLLEYYGEESKKADFSYVPYILINGKRSNRSNFTRNICAEFAVAPPPCEGPDFLDG